MTMGEKAILATVLFDSIPRETPANDLAEELEGLCAAAGLSVAKSFIWKQPAPFASLLIGRGKAETLQETVKSGRADVVVFESSLSASQQRNLEEMLDVKTIDRTQLILDIFALRARSNEGKLQVELAQLKYLLPRLSGKGIYLSRLGGGVGTRGPGEQKLEVDRRRVRERVVKLSRELADVRKRRHSAIQRKKEKEIALIALVGYTNAGKSSLFNALTQASVFVKNQLFSTLDTTTRLVELPGNQKAFLVDTVGFVRDLPHHLIESFKATLEEAINADILLRVTDASDPKIDSLDRAVRKTLEELGADRKKSYLVLNKTDLLTGEQKETLFRKEKSHDPIPVSALTGQGLEALKQKLAEGLSGNRSLKKLFIPKHKLGLAGFLYEEAEVIGREDTADGCYLNVRISEKTENIFKQKLKDKV